jgi:probable rRNA maturation factor
MIDVLLRPEARKLVSAETVRALKTRLGESLRMLGRSRSQVALLLTCDAEIRTLNRNYRKLDRATDVLSFHQQELSGVSDPAGDGVFLGDIVISVETARRRAGQHRLPGELARLAIHGLCHLFGLDHHRPGPAEKMRRLEQKLLRASRVTGRGSSSARSSRVASSRRLG